MSRRRSLLVWSLGQVGLFFRLVLQLLVVGVVASIWRRQFHWRGFAVGLGVTLVGVASIGALSLSGPLALDGRGELALWCGILLAMAAAGAATARVSKRLGFWELYLAWLITVAIAWVQLAKGWDALLGFHQPPGDLDFDVLIRMAPGERWFGAMWDRLVGLLALAGLLVGIVGAALTYLFFGDEGRFDPSFSMERFVAGRHLRGRHGVVSVTALIATLGVALGVAALVSVTAVMSGYQQEVQEKILSTNAHLVVQKYGLDFTEYPTITEQALGVEGVVAGTPFTFNEAMLSDGQTGIGILLKGIEPGMAPNVTGVEDTLCATIRDGHCERFSDSHHKLAEMLAPRTLPGIILGLELYRKLGLPVGAEVALTTPVGIAGARGNAPRRVSFRIAGVFQSGMHEFDVRLTYTVLGAAQELMGAGEAVNGVEFRVRDPEAVEHLGLQVLRAVGRYPYRVLDWRDINASIFTALKLQKIVMFLVLCLIVVVAAFNIASTLFMAVVEKSSEIGVLKSMGASDTSIMKTFVLQGLFVGGVGTSFGIALGLAVCALLGRLHITIAKDVYMVESLQVRMQPLEVSGIALAALCVSFLATLYPALRAARQPPVEAMRWE